MLAALPVCAEEAAAPAPGEGNGHVTLVAEPQALIPVYVDEEAEGAEGTVAWLAEAGQSREVIHITRALSDFFRISLSQGKDWIPLSEEIKHLTGYLTIQKIRYRDILDYEIEIPEELGSCQVLKLLLQPLVENAIYHGVKHRRGRGLVRVTGRMEDSWLILEVADNGAGMTDERLMKVRDGLSGDGGESAGYGLFNVNKRIQLYYNQPQGVWIESRMGEGTTVTLKLPVRSLPPA